MMDDRGASRHTVIETLLRDVFDWQQHLVIDDAVPETLTEIVADHGIPSARTSATSTRGRRRRRRRRG